MRAFAVRSFGEPASVYDLPVPAADGAVLIGVRFAAVNHHSTTTSSGA